MDSSTRRVFFFVHVPKCGGSTFKTIMQRNFGRGYREEYRLLEPRALRYRRADMNRLIDFLPSLRFFSAHAISTDLPYERDDVDVTALAFVRDPVDRIVSWYFYNRNTHEYAQMENRIDLAGYLDFVHDEYDFDADPWRFSQVADLTDTFGDDGLRRVHELVSAGNLRVFPLPRFDEAMCLLEHLFPSDFQDCSYPARVNVSTYDQSSTAEVRERTERLGAIASVRKDRQLLALAEERMDALIEKRFGTELFAKRLESYRARCRTANNIERWLKRPARRVKRALTSPALSWR